MSIHDIRSISLQFIIGGGGNTSGLMFYMEVLLSLTQDVKRKKSNLYQELAQRFNDELQLKQPPIGLAFVDEVPESVQHTKARVPSACTFWRLGEQGVFYATAEDHSECPIGMMTMGFPMPERISGASTGVSTDDGGGAVFLARRGERFTSCEEAA